MTEYSEGICGDGIAILKDGQPMTVSEILSELRESDYLAFFYDRIDDFLGGAEDAVKRTIEDLYDEENNEEG